MDEEPLLFALPPAQPKPDELKFKERNPIWTECKARLIERYLRYFVYITRHGTYIDGFSGPQEPDKHEMWSAKLVVENKPRLLRNFFFFELNPKKVVALRQMWNAQLPPDKAKGEPIRCVEFYPGDFNQKLPQMLSDYPVKDKEATFCLLDQRTFECKWKSVQMLASHKQGGNKIELFYFFAEGWIDRAISALKHNKNARMESWWGDAGWVDLKACTGARRADLVCQKFKKELGYRFVHPHAIYEKRDLGGRIMYYMIHASDHPEAPKLMSRAYGKALDVPESPEQLDWLVEDARAAQA